MMVKKLLAGIVSVMTIFAAMALSVSAAKPSSAVKIGDAGFKSLESALFAAKDGDTLEIIESITQIDEIVVDKNITIKADGCYINLIDEKSTFKILADVTIAGNLQITQLSDSDKATAITVGSPEKAGKLILADYVNVSSPVTSIFVENGTAELKDHCMINTTSSKALDINAENYKNGKAGYVIKGGYYKNNPSKLLIGGKYVNFVDSEYVINKISDQYMVHSLTGTEKAMLGNIIYMSLELALSEAESGDTIKLLNSFSFEKEVVFPENMRITFDLNSFQLIIDNGNKNGIVINKGADVTFKNGEIVSIGKQEDEAVLLNYGKLTLENAEVRRENYVSKAAIESHCGDILITDCQIFNGSFTYSIILCNDEAYPEGTKIVIDGDASQIKDDILLKNTDNAQAYDAAKHSLKIAGGNIYGKIVDERKYAGVSALPKIVEITGGNFNYDVSDYCTDEYVVNCFDYGAAPLFIVAKRWETMTDSGAYDTENNKGVIRFSFKTGACVKSYGIRLVNTSSGKIEESNVEKIGSEMPFTNIISPFYCDIAEIEKDAASDVKYFARAYYVNDDDKYHWSDMVECSVDWNRTFTSYTAQ